MNRQKSIIVILILLALGTKGSLLYALEEYGHTVESYNLIDMKVEKKHYSSIAEYYAYPVHITLENEANMTFGSILPVYIKDKGWVRAQLIKKGDIVLFYQDGKTQLLEIKKLDYGKELYQFYTYVNVADNHNYFKAGVLVHNKGDSEGSGSGGNKDVDKGNGNSSGSGNKGTEKDESSGNSSGSVTKAQKKTKVLVAVVMIKKIG